MECIYPNDGRLLTQYMLNLLNDEDRCRFEEHIMNCESCRLELSKTDPAISAIGVNKEHIVEALHAEGISFGGLREELISANRKKRILHKSLVDLSGMVNWVFRTKRLVLAAGAAAVALLIVLLLTGPKPDNPYLSILSFEKFAYQEPPTRAKTPTVSMNPLFLEGMKAYNENDYKDAARILMNATQESPNEWPVWFFLGVSYYLDKQAKPAIDALLEADNLNRYSLEIEIKWCLAQAYLLNKDSNSALPYLLWLKEKPGDYSSKADVLLKAIQEINNHIQ